MDEQQKERPKTTGGQKKVRIEGWFTPLERKWLRAHAEQHGLSVSKVLRFAVAFFVHHVYYAEKARTAGRKKQ
ncbi:hypothetical protein MYX84_05320 [Acidobacteria bacterium AH-259-O06]|nr:hypothetical protein [Acidobacteria bacterium AH-259-O06]